MLFRNQLGQSECDKEWLIIKMCVCGFHVLELQGRRDMHCGSGLCRLDGTGVKESDLKLKVIKYYHRLFTKTSPFLFSVLDQDVSCISMKQHFHGKLFFLVPMVMCSLLDFHGVHLFHTKRFCLLDNY
jgi:hypothetical protein